MTAGEAAEDTAALARAERAVCAIFAELLRRDSVRGEDDFFELGGHSMLATRLVNRLKDEFQVEVSLLTMFENPTPAALARQLPRGRRARPALPTRLRTGAAARGGAGPGTGSGAGSGAASGAASGTDS